MIPGVKGEHCRTVDIMADAAQAILTQPSSVTGNFFIDETVLRNAGVTNFDKYAVVPGSRQLLPDLFL
jgi:citronellol/citronellal dehydrogenase